MSIRRKIWNATTAINQGLHSMHPQLECQKITVKMTCRTWLSHSRKQAIQYNWRDCASIYRYNVYNTIPLQEEIRSQGLDKQRI